MLKVFSSFTGYGGAEWGLKLAGIPFETVGYSEIDKAAIQCYEQNFPGTKNYGDITKINPEELPDFDLLTGGFPCPTFSIAGKRKGFDDPRGRLFFDMYRIIKVKKPKYLLLENVKGLVNHDGGRTMQVMLDNLRGLGYGVSHKVLNSKKHGIPQNRERVWFSCKLGGWDFMGFNFPLEKNLPITVKDILEQSVDKKYYFTEKQLEKILESLKEKDVLNNDTLIIDDGASDKFMSIGKNVSPALKSSRSNYGIISPVRHKGENKPRQYHDIIPTLMARKRTDEVPIIITGLQEHQGIKTDGVVNCLPTAMGGGGGHISIIQLGVLRRGEYGNGVKDDGTSFTLDCGNDIAIAPCLIGELAHQTGFVWTKEVFKQITGEWRRLTPREYFRLMGFLKDEINISGISDGKLYGLAGNGWDVNMASLIIKNMFKNGNYNL